MGNICMGKMHNNEIEIKRVRRTNNINIKSIDELHNYWKSDISYDTSISDKDNVKRVIHKLGI